MDDRDAWCQRLVLEHDRAVRRLATSVERDVGRQQDLVQDIWLAVWQALPRFRGDCNERTFVFRIAHNRAVSHVQHWARRHVDSLNDDFDGASSAPDPEQVFGDRQTRARLQAAVRTLPLAVRQVVVLTLEGWPARDVADVVGISENNVAVRLSRARAMLAKALVHPKDKV